MPLALPCQGLPLAIKLLHNSVSLASLQIKQLLGGGGFWEGARGWVWWLGGGRGAYCFNQLEVTGIDKASLMKIVDGM